MKLELLRDVTDKIRSYISHFEPWWTFLGAPITQEFIFRYLPYQIYLKTGNYWLVGLISSILYAIIHWYFGWYIIIATFVLGLILWWIMVNMGFVPTIIIHVLINLFVLLFWGQKWLDK